MRDAALVARFELMRALRTWRAVALVFLYLVAATGAAFIFARLLWLLEIQLAETLGAAAPTRPGLMLDELMNSRQMRRMLRAMSGDEDVVAGLLDYSPLATFHLWFGLLLAPFFAAAASAESIAIDMRSRALRYEALRTGRLELAMGRFGGQILLVGAATLLSVFGTWGIGTFYMAGHQPGPLMLDLVLLSLRSWAFAVPFVGIGVFCSQLTTSPAWARVLAVAGVAASWVIVGVADYYRDHDVWPAVCDLALTLMPQGWMSGLWRTDGSWLGVAVLMVAMGIVVAGAGQLRFARRDL